MQQIPFIDLVIDLFESTVHVSGDKLAHLQEHFLDCIYSFDAMHRYCCRPHCTKSCIYSQKVPLRIGEFVARNIQS